MTRKIPTRKGTKSFMIRELCEAGNTKRETFSELRPLVTAQIPPMIFSANVSGHREAKGISEQLIDLKNEIGRVYALLGRSIDSSFDSEEIPQEDSPVEIPTVEEDKPRAKGKTRIEDNLREFLRRVREIREFCKQRAVQSESVDNIGVRPAQAAGRLILAGVPVDACLSAMTLHWPIDVRRDAGIRDFDFAEFSRRIMVDRGITSITRDAGTDNEREEVPHFLFGYALILAECRQPIYLVGPAGTGKSHLAKQLAAYMGMRYGETPMSPGATRGDLLGRHTIGGFISAEFVEIYGGGGVFNFEEIDASDASMLIVLNNALAGDELYNSANGEMVSKHDNFIACATGNTLMLGANREYSGREKLDAATIDRWRMGRIFIPLDEDIEESILFKPYRDSLKSK